VDVAARPGLLAGVTAGLALAFGALAASSPRLALGALLGLAFVALAVFDIAAGVAVFAILAVGENMSLIAATPVIKLTGIVLLVVMIGKHAPLFLLVREQPAIAIAATFLVGWALVSSIWAPDSGVALQSAFRFALNTIFLFIVYGAVRDLKHARMLAYSIIVGATLVSLYGAQSLSSGGHAVTDATGDPNYLASILVPALMMTLFLVVGSTRPRVRMALIGSAIIMGVAIFLTGSRGGLVSLAVALIMAVILAGEWRGRILSFVAAVVILGVGYLAFFAPPEIVSHVTNFTARGGAGRADLWKVATSVAERDPVLGAGAGNFRVVAPAYAAETVDLPQVQQIVGTPNVVHNTYLSLLAELGVPGLLAFLFIAAAATASAARSVRIARFRGDRQLELLGRGTLVALVALFSAFFFLTGEYQKFLWLFLGLGIALSSIAQRQHRL
jgi:O-antigen ligase